MQAAFATRESTESELLETPAGEYFVVRTDRVTPARIPALTEVEAKVDRSLAGRGAAQARRRQGQGGARQGQCRRRPRRDRQGAWPGAAHHQGRSRATRPITGNYLTQPAAQELFKLPVGKAAVGAQRRRQRHRAAQADPAGRPRQGQGRARPLRQAARHHGRQRPDPPAPRRAAHQVRRDGRRGRRSPPPSSRSSSRKPAMSSRPSSTPSPASYDAGKPQLVWTKLVADLETPVSAYLKLADGRANSFLLESVEGGSVRGRYSIIGFKPDVIWRCTKNKAEINRRARSRRPCLRAARRPAARDAARADPRMPDGAAARACRRWRPACSASWATTWSATWSGCRTRTPIRSACPTRSWCGRP